MLRLCQCGYGYCYLSMCNPDRTQGTIRIKAEWYRTLQGGGLYNTSDVLRGSVIGTTTHYLNELR